mmetsp:Transcript_5638/g.20194  ORF Transcript_5638/g.20194 Transcript_5638/m.20194 type:complete len:606 (-) Transcript_5638:7-1824(-)
MWTRLVMVVLLATLARGAPIRSDILGRNFVWAGEIDGAGDALSPVVPRREDEDLANVRDATKQNAPVGPDASATRLIDAVLVETDADVAALPLRFAELERQDAWHILVDVGVGNSNASMCSSPLERALARREHDGWPRVRMTWVRASSADDGWSEVLGGIAGDLASSPTTRWLLLITRATEIPHASVIAHLRSSVSGHPVRLLLRTFLLASALEVTADFHHPAWSSVWGHWSATCIEVGESVSAPATLTQLAESVSRGGRFVEDAGWRLLAASDLQAQRTPSHRLVHSRIQNLHRKFDEDAQQLSAGATTAANSAALSPLHMVLAAVVAPDDTDVLASRFVPATCSRAGPVNPYASQLEASTLVVSISPPRVTVQGYQKFTVTPQGMSDDNDRGYLKSLDYVRTMLDSCRAENPEGVRVIDIGCNTGGMLFQAALAGYTTLRGVEHDREAVRVARAAAAAVRSWGASLSSVWDVSDFRVDFGRFEPHAMVGEERGDVVIAAALVHWLYSATADFGSLDAIVDSLAAHVTARGHLVVEWVDPTDFSCACRYGLLIRNRHVQREPYTFSEFEAALWRHFESVRAVDPRTRSTRQFFIASGPRSASHF